MAWLTAYQHLNSATLMQTAWPTMHTLETCKAMFGASTCFVTVVMKIIHSSQPMMVKQRSVTSKFLMVETHCFALLLITVRAGKQLPRLQALSAILQALAT